MFLARRNRSKPEVEYDPSAPKSHAFHAHFEDYDGAPDADPGQALTGHGSTELNALADILEGAEALEDEERIAATHIAIKAITGEAS